MTLLIFLESDAECLLEKTAIADAPAIAHGRLSANQPPTKTVRPADFVLRLVWARLDSAHGFTGFLKSEEHRYFLAQEFVMALDPVRRAPRGRAMLRPAEHPGGEAAPPRISRPNQPSAQMQWRSLRAR